MRGFFILFEEENDTVSDEQQYLMLPGPTPVPGNVLRALSTPMINHRGPQFKELIEEVTEGVKKVYQTQNHVVTFPSAGTGAMEAAVVNFISPGDRVLSVSIGVFGDRFAKIARAFGAEVEQIEFPWGEAADAEAVGARLAEDRNHEIKVILVTHNETSTGVVNDIKAIRQAAEDHPALLIVDAVSSLGAIEVKTDEWNLDVVVSGSQKAFMIPPGLSFLAISPRALQVAEKCTSSRYYWDIKSAVEYLEKGQTPYTPAISLYYGLRESLRMMQAEGMEKTFARHALYRDMVRGGIQAMGLRLLADDKVASSSLTAVVAPENIGANRIRSHIQENFDVIMAGGQQKLNDIIFRIGHLGHVRCLDLLAVLAALEITLVELGMDIELGRGVKRAQEILAKGR
ncbi:MAG: alanine--glyoxylate aminotransferase family protein [Syntrophomonadaceae bacterium]|jgi:aspartate aminotransferase-like enzyme|nr:alanine--glyoxylate aminotransferase family protein [Syntrophomonadaceae bacterium]